MNLPTARGTHDLTPGSPGVTMASRLELRRHRDVPAFLVAALRLRRIFRSAVGGVRLDLAAQPLRRTFWTLSTWDGDEAIAAYTREATHREVMTRFGPLLADSGFVTWSEPHGAAPTTWATARARLADAARRAAASDQESSQDPTVERGGAAAIVRR